MDISDDRSLYRHRSEYRVRYDDLDTYRHVNNKSFLSYVEDARVHYLVEAMGLWHHDDEESGVMVVHNSIDYMKQIGPFERVRVYTRCTRIGGKSFTLEHLICATAPDAAEERVCARSRTVFSSVDLVANTSTLNDPVLMDRIRAWEPVAPEE